MGILSHHRLLDIDWEMENEDAVILYLEWGNNNPTAKYPPVRSKSDRSNYFVVNTWTGEPVVYLLSRNSEGVETLNTIELSTEMSERFMESIGRLKGVHKPSPEIIDWLKKEME